MPTARIILAGGSGFIGQSLAGPLVEKGYDVVVLTRSPENTGGPTRQVRWDGRTVEDWGAEVDGAAAVINLAGKSVNCRPTRENHRQIIDSRVNSVKAVATAINQAVRPPRVWVQASSLAIYGNPGDKICDESTPPGQGPSVDICRQWEGAVKNHPTPATRRVILRIGFVLGRGGGALGTLEKITRFFLGGRVGSGRQYISWLHMADLHNIVLEAIGRDDLSGAYNVCAPRPVTNAQFMRQLRHAIGRPWSPPAPAWAVRLASIPMGTDPDLALSGRRCIPKRLLEQNFEFQFTDLAKALQDLYPSAK
jgi:uncharacterized protein (TIGR01777 family)